MRPVMRICIVALLFMVTLQGAAASEAQTEYQPATLLSIDRKVAVTPLAYVYNVLVSYSETVTYRLEIRAGSETYFAEYAPDVQPDGPLPSEWKEGAPLQVRIAKRKLIVKSGAGREIRTVIVGKKKNSS